jgi:hypothetical protein
MILKKCLFLCSLFFIFTQCSKPPLDTSKCDNLKTTSVEYLSCLNKLFSSTNTAINVKEFRKHKTLESFFKQVEVKSSD